MSWSGGERLYQLLPAVYRRRDHERGEPLRALLSIIEGEFEHLEADIEGLYEDWFIETCAEWVIPYIGDLVGNRPLHEVIQRRRADVAKTLYYRRRKGKLAVIEELARDVTGWGAHAVEFFQNLGWTQHLNHLRRQPAPNPGGRFPNAVERVGTVNLRSMDALDRLDGPFDRTAHTVDVRLPGSLEGWHNIRNLGIFLWRLNHYTLDGVTARPAAGNSHGFHFHPCRSLAPLFNDPLREAEEFGLAGEFHVAGPIRPLAFRDDPARFYGANRGLLIIKDGIPVPDTDIVCHNLRDWNPPPAGKVAVDVRRSRLAFAPGEEPDDPPQVTFTYGFSADIGGGPYNRQESLSTPGANTLLLQVAKGTPLHTLQLALGEWSAQGQPPCIIRINDSGVYGGNLDISLPAGGWLAVEAEDGRRPTLRTVGVSSLEAPSAGASLILNGLSVEGAFELNGALDLTIQHCTLVPGRWMSDAGEPAFPDRDSLVYGPLDAASRVRISRSILGPIRLPDHIQGLSIEDSIVQAPRLGVLQPPALAGDDSGIEPGPPAELLRCTFFGPVHVRELTASESIFVHRVWAQRRQAGCVRFSYLPPGSATPRRYRCQPDLALEQAGAGEAGLVLARVRPEFTSERHGDPGYAQLSLGCAAEITSGAADGAEMGAFNLLKNPQREANLRTRLEEYLPFGLQPALIYVT
jgi:hypothetical protein